MSKITETFKSFGFTETVQKIRGEVVHIYRRKGHTLIFKTPAEARRYILENFEDQHIYKYLERQA